MAGRGKSPAPKAARRIKRSRETDSDRGEFQEQSRETLHAYAAEWIKRYHGNGRRGFREGSRKEHWRLLNKFAPKYFLTLASIGSGGVYSAVAATGASGYGRRGAHVPRSSSPRSLTLSERRLHGAHRFCPRDSRCPGASPEPSLAPAAKRWKTSRGELG